VGIGADFKQTELGVIPNDWDVRPLHEVAKVTSGKRLPLGYFVGDRKTPYPYIRVTDMRPGGVATRDIKYVPEAAYPPISRYRIFKEDLFISVAGTLGIVGAIPDDLDGANLTENADRISGITCDKDYLLHVMLSPIVQRVIESEQTVGAQPKLALMRIRNFSIPLPPTRDEQRAVAFALNDIEALIGALDRLIAKKRDLMRAAMERLATGQIRLPGFSGEWDRTCLEAIVTRAPGFWGVQKPSARCPKHAAIIRAGDISSDGRLVATASRYLAPDEFDRAKCLLDDVVITTSGNGLGKLWCSDGRSNIAASNFVRVLRPLKSRVAGRFLFYALRTSEGIRQLQEHTATSAYPNLRPTYFSSTWIPLPTLPEQLAIATALSDMDAELAALEARRDKTGNLKRAMMQELLTGRTRLVPTQGTHVQQAPI